MATICRGMVVAVGGPPHSGKSIFLAELYRQLLARRSNGFVFLQRACPDGEGMWSAETAPAVVQEIRRKGKFSQEFMDFTLKSVESLGKYFPLVLLDLGGRRTAENAEILKRSTHLILLSSKEEDEPWCKFAEAEGCKPLAVFRSRLIKREDGSLDEIVRSCIDDLTSSVLRGSMFNLDREGPKEPYEEAISQFADWLIKKVGECR